MRLCFREPSSKVWEASQSRELININFFGNINFLCFEELFLIVYQIALCHADLIFVIYHRLYPWRKICCVEKFQISVKNLTMYGVLSKFIPFLF